MEIKVLLDFHLLLFTFYFSHFTFHFLLDANLFRAGYIY